MVNFRVNEKTRTVRAYNEDIANDEDFNELQRYTKLGYKVILVPKKPREYNHIKKDMIKYLEGNIDKNIYNNFIDGVEKKKNFLKLKWELIHALQEEEKEKAKKEKRDVKVITIETIQEIINQAKSRESKLIENIKKETTSNEDKPKANENE